MSTFLLMIVQSGAYKSIYTYQARHHQSSNYLLEFVHMSTSTTLDVACVVVNAVRGNDIIYDHIIRGTNIVLLRSVSL